MILKIKLETLFIGFLFKVIKALVRLIFDFNSYTEIVPRNTEIVPRNTEIVPRSTGIVPRSTEFFPRSAEIVPPQGVLGKW